MQSTFGVIPNIRAKGKASARVADILNRMQIEEPVNASDVLMLQLIGFLYLFDLRIFYVVYWQFKGSFLLAAGWHARNQYSDPPRQRGIHSLTLSLFHR